jgi:hypothetical protein
MSILINKPSAATRKDLALRIVVAIETRSYGALRPIGVMVHEQAWDATEDKAEHMELILEALGVRP